MKTLKRLSEPEARAVLEALRWPDGPVCPNCGKNERIVAVTGGRAGLKRCKDCRKQFTVTVGTIFERTHVPLQDWVYAFHAMCASKKGISALQLQRELGCQYKTAWFMCHRIREAMKSDCKVFGGAGRHVEADETFVGGKPRPGAPINPNRKTPVLALVERSGRAYARVVADVSSDSLGPILRSRIDPRSILQTDSATAYNFSGEKFAGHFKVSHSTGEYWREDGACTNTVESFFALMKRGVYGAFHHVSRKHLNRYCDEFSFRWNTRKLTDAERTFEAIRQAEGKRLTYRAAGTYANPKGHAKN